MNKVEENETIKKAFEMDMYNFDDTDEINMNDSNSFIYDVYPHNVTPLDSVPRNNPIVYNVQASEITEDVKGKKFNANMGYDAIKIKERTYTKLNLTLDARHKMNDTVVRSILYEYDYYSDKKEEDIIEEDIRLLYNNNQEISIKTINLKQKLAFAQSIEQIYKKLYNKHKKTENILGKLFSIINIFEKDAITYKARLKIVCKEDVDMEAIAINFFKLKGITIEKYLSCLMYEFNNVTIPGTKKTHQHYIKDIKSILEKQNQRGGVYDQSEYFISQSSEKNMDVYDIYKSVYFEVPTEGSDVFKNEQKLICLGKVMIPCGTNDVIPLFDNYNENLCYYNALAESRIDDTIERLLTVPSNLNKQSIEKILSLELLNKEIESSENTIKDEHTTNAVTTIRTELDKKVGTGTKLTQEDMLNLLRLKMIAPKITDSTEKENIVKTVNIILSKIGKDKPNLYNKNNPNYYDISKYSNVYDFIPISENNKQTYFIHDFEYDRETQDDIKKINNNTVRVASNIFDNGFILADDDPQPDYKKMLLEKMKSLKTEYKMIKKAHDIMTRQLSLWRVNNSQHIFPITYYSPTIFCCYLYTYIREKNIILTDDEIKCLVNFNKILQKGYFKKNKDDDTFDKNKFNIDQKRSEQKNLIAELVEKMKPNTQNEGLSEELKNKIKDGFSSIKQFMDNFKEYLNEVKDKITSITPDSIEQKMIDLESQISQLFTKETETETETETEKETEKEKEKGGGGGHHYFNPISRKRKMRSRSKTMKSR